MATHHKLVPHLWFAKDAEAAARFYAETFPDSRVDRITPINADTPNGPAGSVKVVEATILGTEFLLLEAGPHHEFNDAISFLVNCETQDEIDRYSNALVGNGGKAVMCGWIIDRWGVRWQISPMILRDMMADRDPAKAKRIAAEALKHKKYDIARLKAVFDGKA